MDTTAIYFALAAIGLVIVLSGLVIFTRRLITSPERRAAEPQLTPYQYAPYLIGGIVILFLLVTIPPVGGGLFLAVFLWGIIDFFRMPAERKALLYQKMAEHDQKPLGKLVTIISLALFIALVISALWRHMK